MQMRRKISLSTKEKEAIRKLIDEFEQQKNKPNKVLLGLKLLIYSEEGGLLKNYERKLSASTLRNWMNFYFKNDWDTRDYLSKLDDYVKMLMWTESIFERFLPKIEEVRIKLKDPRLDMGPDIVKRHFNAFLLACPEFGVSPNFVLWSLEEVAYKRNLNHFRVFLWRKKIKSYKT